VLNKYVFTERLTLEERGDALHEVAIYGPGASAVVKAAVSTDVPLLLPLESTSAGIADQEMTLWRDDPTGTPGWHLVGSATGIAGFWTRMLDMFGQGAKTGKRLLRAIGWAAFNACRIEAGRPIYGIDFDDSVLPAETAQLERAVSFTKGCYIGQEIVARMHARGQLARQMVGIRMESDALPIAGAPVLDEQSSQVGGITSSTLSPVLSNTAICLGMVKKAHIEPGSRVMVPAEGAVRRGTVVTLPFVTPSEVPST
jgi:folate-binding protein YgfZ